MNTLISLFLAQSPSPVQINPTTLPTFFPPARYFPNLGSIVNLLVPLIMAIAAITFGAMLFYAAFLVITAGGNAENIDKAKGVATWGIVGLVVMFMAYLFVQLLALILGVQLPF